MSRWEDIIKMNLKILERKSLVWIHLAQGRSTSNDLLHLLQCKHENLKSYTIILPAVLCDKVAKSVWKEFSS